jgi:menaquinone-dependent protoporphyrinogen IX oxidase
VRERDLINLAGDVAGMAYGGKPAREVVLGRHVVGARWTATFSGALRHSQYGFVTRLIMKSISGRRAGPTDTTRDYEFTDWDAVDTFANELATGLAASGA